MDCSIPIQISSPAWISPCSAKRRIFTRFSVFWAYAPDGMVRSAARQHNIFKNFTKNPFALACDLCPDEPNIIIPFVESRYKVTDEVANNPS